MIFAYPQHPERMNRRAHKALKAPAAAIYAHMAREVFAIVRVIDVIVSHFFYIKIYNLII